MPDTNFRGKCSSRSAAKGDQTTSYLHIRRFPIGFELSFRRVAGFPRAGADLIAPPLAPVPIMLRPFERWLETSRLATTSKARLRGLRQQSYSECFCARGRLRCLHPFSAVCRMSLRRAFPQRLPLETSSAPSAWRARFLYTSESAVVEAHSQSSDAQV